MLTLVIWWSGVLLEFLLLLQGVRGRLLRRFPLFYSYVLFVLAETLLLFGVYRWAPQEYVRAYWIGEYLGLALGSLILFEIYRVALRPFPGTARMVRNLLGLVFALTIAKVLVNHSFGPLWWPARTYDEMERNLRVVQCFAVLAITFVIFAYAIPRNRHLKGILAGYGLFVAGSIVQLSFRTYLAESHQHLFVYLEPLLYLLVLCIWTAALWSPVAEPSHSPSPLEIAAEDHAALVSRTQQDLQNIQLGLPGAARR